MQKWIILVCLGGLFYLSATVSAQTKATDSTFNNAKIAQITEEAMKKEDYFAVGGAGMGGSLTKNEKELHPLLRSTDKEKLLKMARSKNHVTQLYGLLGLRYLNATEYKAVAEPLLRSSAKVTTMSGCVVDLAKVSVVAKRIINGEYDAALKYDMKQGRR